MTDGMFVAPPGQEKSYVRELQFARTFATKEDAERERCVENERVRAIDEVITG